MRLTSLLAATLALAAGLALAAPSLAADLVITIDWKDLDTTPPTVETRHAYLASDRLKMEIGSSAAAAAAAKTPAKAPAKESEPSTLIYRGDRQQVWVVDPATRSYFAIDKESMAGVSKQMDDTMKEMEKQLAALPPEQRKMVEEAMKGKAAPGTQAQGAATPPPFELVRTERKETIAGYPCVCYERREGKVKHGEVWVTSWDRAGVTEESFAVYRNLSRFFQDVMAATPMFRQAAANGGFEGMDRVDGFPILMREFEDGKPVSEILFRSVEKRKLDPATFEVPAGYTAKSLEAAGSATDGAPRKPR